MIYELLREGRENTTTTQNIMIATGLTSKRAVRKQVSVERQDGKVILSSTTPPGGYYLPANAAEVREFVRTVESKGKGSLLAVRSARRYLEQIEGQQDLRFDNGQDNEKDTV